MAKPYLPDVKTFIEAGIDPKTGLPRKFGSMRCTTKEDIKKIIRVNDEQIAVNKGTWYNLPCNLSSQELERMLYYKGQLAFFYMKDLNEFYFMPYALDGTIDFYGRYNTIHPVPMTSGTDDKAGKAQAEYLSTLKLKCQYGVKLPEDLTMEDLTNSAVILRDYTNQLSQTTISRQVLNDPLIDLESDCMPFLRTALLMGTGVKGVRVADADQESSVKEASKQLEDAALSSQPYLPIVGSIDFQELTDGTLTKAEDYLLSMQSLDNFRLSTHGVDNGGLFEKKAHILQSEANMNGGPTGLVMQDATSIRQNFCNIVNSIWGLGIWYEPSENLTQADINGDGLLYDRNEGQSSGNDMSNGGNKNE